MIANGPARAHDDARHTQYVAALAAASRLLATISPQPTAIEIRCYTFTPEVVEIRANAHKDLGALQQWQTQLGGDLVHDIYPSGGIHWSLSVEIAGVPVELWTLLDAPEAEQAGGAA
ncbi:MAG: hypothetical protein HOZ81_50435 [Streptomyces sp.]|nr:hypothetical protein [Streptomyces sp.]NUS24393.1 hypothetical protein [Streptomyces sp.]